MASKYSGRILRLLSTVMLLLPVFLSQQAYGYDFYDLMRESQLEVGQAYQSAPIAQPANPLVVRYCDRQYCYIETLNESEIDDVATAYTVMTGRIPLAHIGKGKAGLHLQSQSLADSKGTTFGSSFSVGAYVSHPIVGPLEGLAWLAGTRYNIGSPPMVDDLWVSENAATITAGIGLRATILKHLTASLHYEYTGKATIKDLQYKIGSREISPPARYQEPPFTYYPSATLRFEVGFKLTFLPSGKSLQQAKEKRIQSAMESAMSPDIPETYKSYAGTLARSIIEKVTSPIKVEWDAERSTLTFSVPTGLTYRRPSGYNAWAASRDIIDAVYTIDAVFPQLQTDFADRLLRIIAASSQSTKAQGMISPAKIQLSMRFTTCHWEPVSITRDMTGQIRSQSGGESDYWEHLATVTLAVDANTGDVSVISSRTEVTSGGYSTEVW